LIFVDKVCNNTSQTKDSQVQGQTYLCSKDSQPPKWASTKDGHFTVLGFTAANGEPLLCAIIFAAKTMRHKWVTGFDSQMEWIGDEQGIEASSGNGRAYPYGAVCVF
jgi:hypothetical protein